MTTSVDVWHSGRKDLIWERFCGHFYLNIPQFMAAQEELLLEQIGLLSRCELGRHFLGENAPLTVQEFRTRAPLTTYASYDPYLPEKREAALPAKPRLWMRASGPGGSRKAIPVTPKTYELLLDYVLEIFILASSPAEGRFSLEPGDAVLNASPPLPWFAGTALRGAAEHFGFRLIPPTSEAFDRSTIEEKSAQAFQMALRSGLDVMLGVTSVLARMGEQFALQSPSLRHIGGPKAMSRVASGRLRKLSTRGPLLPRDLWKIKGVVGGGADSALFGQRIKRCWGADLFDIFPMTEYCSCIGTPTWAKGHFTFQPNFGFLEFIPEPEVVINRRNPSVQPTTVLFDQLKAGEVYEVVFTSFHGGAFVRYRTGDLVQITALEDAKTGIRQPHFTIKGRADRLINMAAFARIDERFIGAGLERAQISCDGWFARKEIEGGYPVLHIYVDTNHGAQPGEAKRRLNESLSVLDRDYMNIEKMLGCDPLRLTLLPHGTVFRWRQEMSREGRDAPWMSDQRMQTSDEVIDRVLQLSRKAGAVA
ncbi:MAG: GH3 auxin-responsive promoter family protein [Chloroflexi bacterium]|nr:GH3 auxin-responsive promoter family protein [Chloroflexota bacterium]